MSQHNCQRRVFWIAAGLLLVLAFALRLGSIEYQPLHYDEGNNVYFGRLTFANLLKETIRTSDTDPGGHRYALGFWMDAAGPSPFSIRLFSVVFSVLTVALTYRLARQLHLSIPASLIAAALMAVSPYAIDYGQQAKGYAMGAALALVAWGCWIGLIEGAPARRSVCAVGYVVFTAAMISAHFYMVLVLGMQWVWALGTGHIRLPAAGVAFADGDCTPSRRAAAQCGVVNLHAVQLPARLGDDLHGHAAAQPHRILACEPERDECRPLCRFHTGNGRRNCV